MANKEAFATRLKELRKEKGITQKQLAKELDISLPSVIHYENANRFPGSAVLTLLIQFFGVSRAYLMGETDERGTGVTWDDSETIKAVRESLPTQVNNLNDILKNCSDMEQKLAFDLLVELSHVLKLRSPEQRSASVSLLQNVFSASTRYVDVCVNAAQDADPVARVEKAKQATLSQYTQALDDTIIFLSNQITVVC